MKLYCPQCKQNQPVNLVFVAEKTFNTETKEINYNDLDFARVECDVCYYDFEDERQYPELTKELYEEGWKAT